MEELDSGQYLRNELRLVECLSRRARTELWLADDRLSGRKCVAKILPAGAEPAAVRFLENEYRLLQRLDHPHIVKPVFLDTSGARAFFTMEYREGADIGALRERTPREIVAALIPVAAALGHAHRRGVVHRDVKVSNVLLCTMGRACLVDFGTAGVMGGVEGLDVRGGGSRHNVSPQQLDGEPPQAADDVYGLGVLLYELLTGQPPFGRDASPDEVRESEPEPLRSSHVLPPRLVSLVARLLAKSTADRPRDMDEVQGELEAVAQECGSQEPSAASPPARRDVGVAARKPVILRPPPRVAPPTQRLAHAAGGDQDHARRLRHLTFAGFAGLALVAIGVFVYLPRFVASRPAPELAQSHPRETLPVERSIRSATASADPSPEAGLAVGRRAQESLGRVARLREGLEASAVGEWGGNDWAAAVTRVGDGDRALAALDSARAVTEYEAASVLLEGLIARTADVLHAALAQGVAALESGDAASAQRAFERALRIAPGHAAATSGLRRAAVLDQVVAALESGAHAERRGHGGAAARAYRTALDLDPQSSAARGALTRVEAKRVEDVFALAMAEAGAAVDASAWASAREALRRAAIAKPSAPEIAQWLTRIEEAERQEAIPQHGDRAAALEQKEEWRAALEQYEAILKLDPTIRFAQEGRSRTLRQAELTERLEAYLASPGRLSAATVLSEAETLVVAAAEVPASGPRHLARVARLESLIAAYTTPVEVRLMSDAQTDVTVYKVGHLGAFQTRALNLRPGKYTVVGTRRGYRDVRREIVVDAGQPAAPLLVVCEEKI